MQIDIIEIERENGRKNIRFSFYHHQSCVFLEEIDISQKNSLDKKLKIVDNYFEKTFCPVIDKKHLLLAFAKVDEQIKEYYKKQYPKGGKRENAGRKVGWRSDKPKTNRTERFTQAITLEEKEFLTKQLKEFRSLNNEEK